GHVDHAERLLIAQRRDARRSAAVRMPVLRAFVDTLYGWTVGYGYRPGRAFAALVILLAVVTVSLLSPGIQGEMRATTQDGTVYAVDGHVVGRGPAPGTLSSAPATASTGAADPAQVDACGSTG